MSRTNLRLPQWAAGDGGRRRCLLDTPIGALAVVFEGEYLVELSFPDRDLPGPGLGLRRDRSHASNRPESVPAGASGADVATDAFREFRRELDLYFEGRLRSFSVQLRLSGPPFFIKVWQALMEIPFGETRTYAQIASLVGSPRACRTVGNACAANPVAIVVPCHRVVASGGLGGYGGGLARKEWLLRHEARQRSGLP